MKENKDALNNEYYILASELCGISPKLKKYREIEEKMKVLYEKLGGQVSPIESFRKTTKGKGKYKKYLPFY